MFRTRRHWLNSTVWASVLSVVKLFHFSPKYCILGFPEFYDLNQAMLQAPSLHVLENCQSFPAASSVSRVRCRGLR